MKGVLFGGGPCLMLFLFIILFACVDFWPQGTDLKSL